MRAKGAKPIACGPDGASAWAKVGEAHRDWREKAADALPRAGARAREGTLAKAFEEYRATNEWRTKKPRTREEWERCWTGIGPAFGSCRPSAVALAEISGFRQKIEDRVGASLHQNLARAVDGRGRPEILPERRGPIPRHEKHRAHAAPASLDAPRGDSARQGGLADELSRAGGRRRGRMGHQASRPSTSAA